MSTPDGLDPQMIANPPYYVQGRKIQPIDVIEEWSFCHHLGCVVKYVARLGRKSVRHQNPAFSANLSGQMCLEDLQKAEWYLMREIAEKPCHCIPRLQSSPTMPEAIAKDWRLSPPLKEVIFYLTTYQRLFCRFPVTKIICLKQALTHLRTEIRSQESRIDNQDQQPIILGENIIIFKDLKDSRTKDARVRDAHIKGGEPCGDQPE